MDPTAALLLGVIIGFVSCLALIGGVAYIAQKNRKSS